MIRLEGWHPEAEEQSMRLKTHAGRIRRRHRRRRIKAPAQSKVKIDAVGELRVPGLDQFDLSGDLVRL
jgi:hypothetical protein